VAASAAPEPAVRSGQVIALRLFDVAYAIDLTKAETAWARQPGYASSRARLDMTPTKAVAFGVPPVELSLPPVKLKLGEQLTDATISAQLFDFGAIALSASVAAQDMPWVEFAQLLNAVDRAIGFSSGTQIWTSVLAKLCALLDDALVRPSDSRLEEDYLIGVVRAFSEPLSAAELTRRIDLIPLLSGEQRELSQGARQDLMRQRFSYYTDDLAVVTWDRAFIYEPRGDSDVIDVLVVANAQLLEMRYYDELLDAELPRMYEHVARTRRTRTLLAPRRYADLARRLYTLVAEVTELTEKVDNALQVTEDVYLARIYSAVLDLFRVPAVTAVVNRKLAIIRDTYAALHDEAFGSRAGFMELLIILLIALEIVLALLKISP
jgi:hypothetical protein